MREKAHPALKKALRPVRRRVRLHHALWYGSAGVLAACAGCAVFAAVSYFIPIPHLPERMGLAAFGLLALAVAAGLLKPVSYELAARRADAGGLRERAITALYLFEDTPMALLQREDALRHVKSLPLKDAVPLKGNKRLLLMALAVALAAAGALIFIPNPQNEVLKRREAFQKAMAEQLRSVEEEAKKLDESAYTKEELNALRKLMGDLARELQNTIEPQQAFLAMDKAQRELESLQRNVSDKARMEAAQAFSQSGLKDFSEALAMSDMEAAAKAMEQLAKAQSGAQSSSSAALEQAANALPEGALKEAAAQAAQALKAGNPQSLNAALSALNSAMQSTCSGSLPGNLGNISALLVQLRAGTLSASQSNAGMAAGSGQGQGTGTGSGQGVGSGKGAQGGAGAGKGSTNLDGGISKPGASSQGQGANPPEYKLAQYETIYDPTRLNGADDVHQSTGAMGEGESQQMQLGPGLGNMSDHVPYHEVIFSYQEAASKAAQQELLPEGMQQWVDGYFQALID